MIKEEMANLQKNFAALPKIYPGEIKELHYHIAQMVTFDMDDYATNAIAVAKEYRKQGLDSDIILEKLNIFLAELMAMKQK